MEDLAHQPTVPALIRHLADKYGDRVMAKYGDQTLTFRQAERQSAELALALLASGVGKASRLGVLMPNSLEWIISWLAAVRIGALVAGVSTFLKPRELAWLVRFGDFQTLLVRDTYLRRDYVRELEEALPSLAAQGGAKPLVLAEAPYLRSVWTWGDQRPAWARGSGADLLQLGRGAPGLDEAFLEAVEAQVSPADLGVVIFTSGTTADPKGVVHSHGTVVRRAYDLLPFGPSAVGETVGVMTPLFWIGGLLTNVLNTMIAGGTLVIPERPDAGYMVEFLKREKLDYLNGWAGQFNAIRQHPDFDPQLFADLKPTGGTQGRAGIVGPPSDVSPLRIPSLMGMTESFGPHTGEAPGTVVSEELSGSHGRTIGGIEQKIIDPDTGEELPAGQIGELLIRGPLLMQGYYKRERFEVFEPDGFFRTGDRCHLSKDGHLFFHGRTGEMIKTSGANVAPQEVERVLMSFADVQEAYVMGRPDASIGEMVVAVVVPKAGANPGEAELRARLDKELSSYKVPKRIAFAASADLPRSASEKIQKHKLLEMFDFTQTAA